MEEWVAFNEEEPIGAVHEAARNERESRKQDYRTGLIAAAALNAQRTRQDAVEVNDLVPTWREATAAPEAEARPMTVEESVALVAELNAAFGGRDLRALKGG